MKLFTKAIGYLIGAIVYFQGIWLMLFLIEFTDSHYWEPTHDTVLLALQNTIDLFWGIGMFFIIFGLPSWPLVLFIRKSNLASLSPPASELLQPPNSQQIEPPKKVKSDLTDQPINRYKNQRFNV